MNYKKLIIPAMIVIITAVMATSMVSAAEPAQTNPTEEQTTTIASDYEDAQAAADTAKSEAIRAEAEAAAAENRVIEYKQSVSDAQHKADQAKQDYDQAKANATKAATTAAKTSDEIQKVHEEVIEYESTAAKKQEESDYWNNKVTNLTAAKIDCQEWIDMYQEGIVEAEQDRLDYFGRPDKTSQYLYQYAIEKKAKYIALKAEAEENMSKIMAELANATIEAEKAARVAAQAKEIATQVRSIYKNICAETEHIFSANKTAADACVAAEAAYNDAMKTVTDAEHKVTIAETDAKIAKEAATTAAEIAKNLQAKADAIKNGTAPVTPDTVKEQVTTNVSEHVVSEPIVEETKTVAPATITASSVESTTTTTTAPTIEKTGEFETATIAIENRNIVKMTKEEIQQTMAKAYSIAKSKSMISASGMIVGIIGVIGGIYVCRKQIQA